MRNDRKIPSFLIYYCALYLPFSAGRLSPSLPQEGLPIVLGAFGGLIAVFAINLFV